MHLLPNVIAELKKQRKQNPGTTWVFEGPRVFPLDLATLGSKTINIYIDGYFSGGTSMSSVAVSAPRYGVRFLVMWMRGLTLARKMARIWRE